MVNVSKEQKAFLREVHFKNVLNRSLKDEVLFIEATVNITQYFPSKLFCLETFNLCFVSLEKKINQKNEIQF